ncbi:hypothetical protein HRbin06_00999 [archaeon HR06]|nr:hypothetical protein HRbin06_00999 [archaeon HR06]
MVIAKLQEVVPEQPTTLAIVKAPNLFNPREESSRYKLYKSLDFTHLIIIL